MPDNGYIDHTISLLYRFSSSLVVMMLALCIATVAGRWCLRQAFDLFISVADKIERQRDRRI